MILGIDAQIEAMMAIWPELSLVARNAQAAAWNGPVRPLLQTYRIGIVYRAPMVVENLDPRRLQPHRLDECRLDPCRLDECRLDPCRLDECRLHRCGLDR